jgi:5-oxopent-3-ene-1,2,5-tricarboxylate decarboxylase/2-hydroxyhepta-2,4-diene-1,7-dioate isomerase
VLKDGGATWGRLEGDEIVLETGARVAEAKAQYLAPAEPTKIMAVHLTYRSRVEEYEARPPAEPSYFLKPPTSLNGHRGVIRRPEGTRFLNYEGELAVVVGQRMRGVRVEDALSYVAGYTCANDVGLHDFRHADRGSMFRVKGQDGFLPLGPELVEADEFDPTSFTLRTYVNGEVVQEGGADDLLFSVAYQLADVSRLVTLEPGDVLLTGTPANSRPMQPGDTVEVEIDGIGRLSNTVEEWRVDLSEAGEQPETSANTLHVALAVSEDEAEKMVRE